MCSKFSRKTSRLRDYLRDLDIGGKIILKWISEKLDFKALPRLVWFRIRPEGALL
jgi:hypothetical protein